METMENDIVEIPLDFSKLPPRASEEENARATYLTPEQRKRGAEAFKNAQTIIAELRERGIVIEPTPL